MSKATANVSIYICDIGIASQYHHPMPSGSLALLLVLSVLIGCTEPNKPNLEVA
jgi:hypothetical protein